MVLRVRRLAAVVLAAVVLSTGTGCGGTSDDTTTAPTPPGSPGPWLDIDTSMPSEDPVGTVFGYVQAMAAGDSERACQFQYRGSTNRIDRPCVLADEQPARDAGWPAATWTRLAAYRLEDYLPSEDDRGWVVALPDEPDARWRIRQDDAGIWHILSARAAS